MTGRKRKISLSGFLTHLLVMFLGGALGRYIACALMNDDNSLFLKMLFIESCALGLWLFWNLYSFVLAYFSGSRGDSEKGAKPLAYNDFQKIRSRDSITYLPLIILIAWPKLGGLAELFVAGRFAVIWLIFAVSLVFLLKIAHFTSIFAGKRWAFIIIVSLAIGGILSEIRLSPATVFDAFTLQILFSAQFAALGFMGAAFLLFKKGKWRIPGAVLMILPGALGWFISTATPKPVALPSPSDIKALPSAQNMSMFPDSTGVFRVRIDVNKEIRDAMHFVVPGDVSQVLFIPPGSKLNFGVAAPFYASGLSEDGVTFSLLIRGEEKPVWSAGLDPVHNERDRDWLDYEIDLSPWEGTTVELKIKTEGSGHGSVSAPRIVSLKDEPKSPNIVILLIDTLRADRVGFGGYDLDTSPNMDSIAKRGVVFENAISTAPWTEPATAGMLTGLLPGQMGIGFPDVTMPANVRTLGEYLRTKGYTTAGFSGSPLISSKLNFDRGFDLFNERCEDNFHWRSAECLTDLAIGRLEEQTGEPFFLYIHYVDPHARFDAPPPYHDRFSYGYTGASEQIRRGDIVPFVIKTKRGQKIDVSREDARYLEKLYLGEIAYVDAQIGRLFQYLKERGLLENTVLIITADHGEEFMEHGIIGHIFNLHNTLLHVPLVILGPGFAEGGRVVETVSLADITPTLLEMLGIEPEDYVWGRSLNNPAQRPIFAQRADLWHQQRALISGNFKIIVSKSNEKRELYDLVNDPGEYRNLADGALPEENILMNEIVSEGEWMERNLIAIGDEGARQREEHKKRLKALGYIGD